MIQFIITFSWLLILSSFFIISLFHLTRHWIVINPNNTKKVEGDLLKFWSRFIEMKKGDKRIYYLGDALSNKFELLNKLQPNIGKKFLLSKEKFSLGLIDTINQKEIDDLEAILSCKSKWNDNNIFLYIDDPIYVFPKWIRFPLSQCPVCMSSVYGSAIFWSFIYIQKEMFLWANNIKFSYFVFWLIFVVVLSKINRIVYKKTLEYV